MTQEDAQNVAFCSAFLEHACLLVSETMQLQDVEHELYKLAQQFNGMSSVEWQKYQQETMHCEIIQSSNIETVSNIMPIHDFDHVETELEVEHWHSEFELVPLTIVVQPQVSNIVTIPIPQIEEDASLSFTRFYTMMHDVFTLMLYVVQQFKFICCIMYAFDRFFAWKLYLVVFNIAAWGVYALEFIFMLYLPPFFNVVPYALTGVFLYHSYYNMPSSFG